MRTALLLALVFAGCATVSRIDVPPNYITRLVTPVTIKQEILVMDGGSGCLTLQDARGELAFVWMDGSGMNQPGRRKSWYGRDFGTIVLADLKKGRVLEGGSEEAGVLLGLLESGTVAEDDKAAVRVFADALKKKRPNQAPEPTAPSGRGSP